LALWAARSGGPTPQGEGASESAGVHAWDLRKAAAIQLGKGRKNRATGSDGQQPGLQAIRLRKGFSYFKSAFTHYGINSQLACRRRGGATRRTKGKYGLIMQTELNIGRGIQLYN